MSASDQEFLEFCEAATNELFEQQRDCDAIAVAFEGTLHGFLARQIFWELAAEKYGFVFAARDLKAGVGT